MLSPVTLWIVEMYGILFVLENEGEAMAWLRGLPADVQRVTRAWQM